MGFADDLYSIAEKAGHLKSEKDKAIENAKQRARIEYDAIKKGFQQSAYIGDFIVESDKRVMKFDFEVDSGAGRFFDKIYVTYERVHKEPCFLGYREIIEVGIVPLDVEVASVYVSELEQMAKIDGIILEVAGRYRTKQVPTQYFSIPGGIVAKPGQTLIERGAMAVIRCKMTF